MIEVSLNLSSSVVKRLKVLAQLTGRSESFYVTEAVCNNLDELEDIYLGTGESLEDSFVDETSGNNLKDILRYYGFDN